MALSLRCKCCSNITAVMDSRPAQKHGIEAVRRRRVCKKCGWRGTTFEFFTDEQAEGSAEQLLSIAMKSFDSLEREFTLYRHLMWRVRETWEKVLTPGPGGDKGSGQTEGK